ncbi:MAG: hypothetical protein VKJ24_17215 [Synechococcales bacterium]|nr:hypothetical protein [Synechococcales bacterium]
MSIHSSLKSSFSLVFVGMSLSVGLLACGPTKVAQCNAMIDELNKGEALAKKFETAESRMKKKAQNIKGIEDFRNMAKDLSQEFSTLTAEINQYITTVKAVELKDEKLVGYREQAVSTYSDMSAAFQGMADGFKKLQSLEATPEGQRMLEQTSRVMDQISEGMTSVEAEEDKIVKEINTYCGAKS